MSSPSDDKSRSDSEPEYSDVENNGSPETWEAPNTMSQTMMKRMQLFNQSKECDSPSITTEFVTSLSRVSKSETTPPLERERPETTPPPEGERPDLCMLSVKDKAKMFEKTSQEQKTNPFSALKLPPKDYEEAVKTDKDSNPVDTSSDKSSSERTQTDKDTNPVEPLSDKSTSERTQTDKDTNPVEPSSDKSTSERTQTDKDSTPVEPSSDKSTSERTQTDKDSNPVEPSSDKSTSERTQTDKDSNPVDPSSDKSTSGQSNKEKQPLQGHHFSEKPIEEHIPEQLNEGHSELDRTSPWPQQQHPRIEQHPGPQSAHGWPGTPPVRQLLYQSRPYSPYQQRQPLEQKGYIGRPDLPPTGPYNLQNLSPHHMWPGYDYPPRPQHFPPFNPQNRYETPRGIPPKHYRHETPGDIPPQQFRQDPQDTTSREPPVHGEQSPTNPKQVPTKKKTLLGQPGQTPKKSERKGLSEGKKPANKPGIQPTDNKKGPKTAIKPVPPIKKMGPKKIYLCVVGIAKDQSNDTVFNYLEGRSKMEIVYEESLRTEDNPEHAVIVFEDQIDLKVLKQACNSKKLKDSELEFDVIDPPRSVIVSSDDDKLTVKGVTDFLTKKMLETLKVRTTEEGSISVKFKSPKGVTEILKSPDLKISGSNVVISVIYNCDHGTYWDHSLHRVAIPVPYKPKVLDKHVRSFVISITSTCNKHLEQHHACLSIKDEIHIECTLDPKHREARQKVKSWKNTVIKAWDEFVKSNAHKKDLKITDDAKDLLDEHINSTKERHRSDELTVTHDDDSMTIIFVGKFDIVENFYDEVSAEMEEIQENLKRKNRIQTDSMKIKPIEITLILKENKFNQLKNIATDFTYDVNEESGMITFTGVREDISEAKLAVFEVKKNYYSWKMTTLSCNQCRLLKNEAVVDILEQSLSDKDITAVFDIRENEIFVCTTCQDECKPVENIFKETVVEDEIRLDDTSKNVLRLDEWAEQKVNITNQFRDVSYVDDSADDKIVVVATDNVLDEIMKDLDKFVTEHSIYDETIKIKDEAELKYFKMHLKDWVKDLEFQNNVQGLRIKFDNQSLQLSGTKQAITTASSDIHDQIRKIQRNQHTITKAGVDSLFNDQSKTDVLLSPIEEESKTVIIVDQNSLTKAPLHRNPVRKESDEDWVRRQPSKDFSRKGTRPKQGAFTPKSGPVVCKNGTKITLVKKEDIGQQKADVIVCSTNGQLDMTAPVGKSIVKVAGKGILDEIKNTYSEGINHGDIAVVNGYNLQCQKVYLAALPKWTPGGEKIISKCVNTCLLQASKFKSIVFPGMGTGNLHYPRDLVVEVMYQCVQKFDNTNSSLKEIKFLCFDHDTIQAFEREEAKIMNPGYQPAVAAPRKQTKYKKHNITVRVVEGDLGKQKVDVMVSAVPKDLNLESAGGAGISIMKGLGQVVQQDIASQHPNGVTNGALAVVTLSSPVGRCKAVYLTSLDSWDSEKKVKDTDKQIYKFGYSCLETADRAGYKSIAIPAMGTGKIGYPHDKVAAYMYDLVEKFANNNKQSKVSEVIFVVHYTDQKSKQAFLDEEKNRVPPPAPVVETGTHTAVTVKPINDTAFQVGKLTFTVEQGDILSNRYDAIVNGSYDDLDLTKGAVSQAIRKNCDAAKLDDECTKKKDDMKRYGVVSTSGCGLPVKFIIHISSKHKPHEWRKVIKKALHKAERKAVKTLAFPALGTGAGTDQEEMGKTIMESLVEFVEEGQTTHLQHVYLVIFETKMFPPMLRGVRSGGEAVLSADKQKQVIKSSNQQMRSVSFWIYSMSRRETSYAKEQLDETVSKKYKTEKFHDRLISELKEKELSYLQSVENNYPIMLTINQRSSEVTIEGIAEYAMSAKQDMKDWLRRFTHTRHCEAEAEIIKEQVQWYMKNKDPTTGTMTLEPYPPMENMHLENAYRGNSNRTDVDFKDEHGEEYIIGLKTMTEFPKKNPKDRMDVIRREQLQDLLLQSCLQNCDRRLPDFKDWFYKLTIRCDNIFINCIIDKRLETKYTSFRSVLGCHDRKENYIALLPTKNLGQLNRDSMSEFELMYMIKNDNIARNDRNLSKSLVAASNHKRPLLCRWLLANIRNENDHDIDNALQRAFHNHDNQTAKVLAWAITKRFYMMYEELLRNATDLYPGIQCTCRGKGNNTETLCSQQKLIIVSASNKIRGLPLVFRDFRIQILDQSRTNSTTNECEKIIKRLSEFQKESFCLKMSLSSEIAENMFLNHSNLSLICPSVVKSTAFKTRIHAVKREFCIQLYCKTKGIIPLGESHFPEIIQGYPTDVIEADTRMLSNIRIGTKIGSKTSEGTLGGFVEYLDRNCFLTCAHVMYDLKMLLDQTKNFKSLPGATAVIHSPFGLTECGRVIWRAFDHDDRLKTSIDAALIELEHNASIDQDDYVLDERGVRRHFSALGLSSPFLNTSCLDHEEFCIPQQNATVVAPGAMTKIETGITFPNQTDEDIQFSPIGPTAASVNSQTFFPLLINQPAHMQLPTGYLTDKRIFRMYNQIVLYLPLEPGDSGTCIYIVNHPTKTGCIGMAIAMCGGQLTIVTPLKDILKRVSS